MKKLTIVFSLIFGIVHFSNAQQTIEVSLGDTLLLEIQSLEGDRQWEQSMDSVSWTALSGEVGETLNRVVTQIPIYFRAKVTSSGCETFYSETIQIAQTNFKRWSNPSTWGDEGLPVEGQDVVIDDNILLDINTPNLGDLVINGELVFERKDLHLTADRIVVNGLLQVGTASSPFEQVARITLDGTNTADDANDRGIMVNGRLELHGATPNVLWTKLNQHLEKDAKELVLNDEVDWEEGAEIVMAPTDYYEAGNGTAITQKTSLLAVSGHNLTIEDGSNSHRWGRLQYVTSDGMSLDPEVMRVSPPLANSDTSFTPTVLDERAEIGYLTRNIIIESPEDDNLWTSVGFGVHVMIMPQGTAHVEGVHISRGGQRGHLGRYPWHWHNLSYQSPDGIALPVFIGDAEGQYFRNSVVNESVQRGIVIHGTNGVEVSNNIVYHVQGHGIFTEDAVERRNTITDNLVLYIRSPLPGTQLKNHEQIGLHDGGPSGFWISNPDNTLKGNVAADCRGFGFWLAYPEQAWGDHQGYTHPDGFLYQPNRELFGVFDNNVTHTIRKKGIMLDLVEIANNGDVFPEQYASTVIHNGHLNI